MAHVGFATLPVLGLDRAIGFRRDVMGLGVTVDMACSMPSGETSRFVPRQIPGARTRIHLDPAETLPLTNRPALPPGVGDVEAEEKRLLAFGVEIVTPPTPSPWDPDTIHALIRDSEGATILLTSR